MYAIKSLIVFIVLFVALVDAMPTHHRRVRRACDKRSEASSSAKAVASPEATPKSTAAAKELAAEPKSKTGSSSAGAAEPQTTGKANSTSTPTAQTGTGLLAALFPVAMKTGNEGWSTSPDAKGALPLSDATFKPEKLLSALPHPYIAAPDGKKAMKAHYPKGSYTYGHKPQGGLSFYSGGPPNVDLTTAKEATLGYSVMFDKDFEFQKGGKLPGLCK